MAWEGAQGMNIPRKQDRSWGASFNLVSEVIKRDFGTFYWLWESLKPAQIQRGGDFARKHYGRSYGVGDIVVDIWKKKKKKICHIVLFWLVWVIDLFISNNE